MSEGARERGSERESGAGATVAGAHSVGVASSQAQHGGCWAWQARACMFTSRPESWNGASRVDILEHVLFKAALQNNIALLYDDRVSQ